jgi:DNA adenine methylase
MAALGRRQSVSSHKIDRTALGELASRPLSGQRRPFLRWAGSKRSLLTHIVPLLPNSYVRYWEPFLGSGSLFFLLQARDAVLSDSCGELVETFEAVRDDPEAIIKWLSDKKPDREFYYTLRANRSPDAVSRAAEFIYLNRTCWNGLYRVNARGDFNVPYGKPKTDKLIDPENIYACSASLRTAQLMTCDFEEAVHEVEPGDLVFFDPPYVTSHNNNGFVDYNEQIFSWKDQERLASLALRLVARGAHVVVANAAHQPVLDLYRGFVAISYDRASTLAGDSKRRGRVNEVLLYSAPSGS